MLDAKAPKQPGIYALECSNKIYIGSTVNLQRRIHSHFNLLRAGKHHNHYLQRAFDKHGQKAFNAIVLEVLPGAISSELLQREQEWLDVFVPWNPVEGYNIHATADSAARIGRLIPERLSVQLAGRRRGSMTAERKAAIAARLADYWREPGAKEYRAEQSREMWSRPDHRTRIKEAFNQLKLDPSKLDQMRARMEAMRSTSEAKRKANAAAAIRRKYSHPPLECEEPFTDWIVAQYEEGLSVRQIGLAVGISHHSVSRRLKGRHVTVPKRGRGRAKFHLSVQHLEKQGVTDPAAFDAEVAALYVEGHSVNALRKLFGVGAEVLRTSLHRSGVPLRGHGDQPSKQQRFRTDRYAGSTLVQTS